MKILMAGGAGYIGSKLIRSLIEHGYDIKVVDLFWFGDHLPAEAKKQKLDLFNLTEKDLEGFDQVIFLAGLSNDPMAEFSPAMNFVFNGALPSYLAFIAKNAGVRRFIYASSCSVYGYTVNELYDEDSPVTCDYPYGISKLQGERGVMQLKDDNFSVISLRQGTVSGYSPRMRFDLIVNTMFKFAIKQGQITINNPAIWRPILDIRDAEVAYLRAIQADYSISGIFNVASDNYTVGQVGDLVKEAIEETTNRKIALSLKNIQDFRNYKVKLEKARTYLGFFPKGNVETIVKDLCSHLEEFGDFSDNSYLNIDVFRTLRQDTDFSSR